MPAAADRPCRPDVTERAWPDSLLGGGVSPPPFFLIPSSAPRESPPSASAPPPAGDGACDGQSGHVRRLSSSPRTRSRRWQRCRSPSSGRRNAGFSSRPPSVRPVDLPKFLRWPCDAVCADRAGNQASAASGGGRLTQNLSSRDQGVELTAGGEFHKERRRQLDRAIGPARGGAARIALSVSPLVVKAE